MTVELGLVATAAVLLISVLASKASVRSGIPVLLLFLGIGIFLGSEGPGGVYFDDPPLTKAIGVIALIVILFSGGLSTHWSEVAGVLREGLLLSTVGVAITAISVGLLAAWVLGLGLIEGILIGAIISPTDAAAVFAVLRGQALRLKGGLASVLELESGSNDPMAVFLTVGMIHLITGEVTNPAALIPEFVIEMGLGALMGVLFGRIMLFFVNRLRLEYDGLYPVLTLALMLMTYGMTVLVHGNGFLAVYVSGVVMRRSPFIHQRSLVEFHDGLAWLMQIVMFLALGLQVFPSQVAAIAPQGLVIAAFLIFVARPLSVFIALMPTRMNVREKAFLAWVGMRGAAPIILATFPLVAGIASANLIFNVVFFVVVASVALQGTTISRAAKWLGLKDESPVMHHPLLPELVDHGTIEDNIIELVLEPPSAAIGKRVIDLHLPPDAWLMLISRHGEIVVPRGTTTLTAHDRIMVLAAPEIRDDVIRMLTSQD